MIFANVGMLKKIARKYLILLSWHIELCIFYIYQNCKYNLYIFLVIFIYLLTCGNKFYLQALLEENFNKFEEGKQQHL